MINTPYPLDYTDIVINRAVLDVIHKPEILQDDQDLDNLMFTHSNFGSTDEEVSSNLLDGLHNTILDGH